MECSGAPSVIRDVLGRTAASGIVCLVGVTAPGHDFDIDIGELNRTMVLDNDTVFGTVNANRRHYEMAGEALQRADKAWLDRLITRREPLERGRDRSNGSQTTSRSSSISPDAEAESDMAARIEDYAMIGDCQTAALVSRDGSIDWFCCPRFDSDACFAALLGTPEHGRWSIAPRAPARVTRRYRPNTLVLETHFETARRRRDADRFHAAALRQSGDRPPRDRDPRPGGDVDRADSCVSAMARSCPG